MGVEVIVPVAVFATIFGIVWLVMSSGTRRRSDAQATLRLAIEKGQALSAETMEAMVRMAPSNADLRRGIIFVSIAAAFAAFGYIMRNIDDEVLMPMLGISMFPLFIGVAYLGLHAFARDKRAA
jgi:hypothetical protein